MKALVDYANNALMSYPLGLVVDVSLLITEAMKQILGMNVMAPGLKMP